MDVATITRRVQRRFGDSNFVQFTQADLYDWINDAQNEIAREIKCLHTSATAAAGSAFPVTLPATFIRMERVLYGTRALQPVEIEDLDAKSMDLTVAETEPGFYYINANKLYLYPIAATTNTTTVTYNYSNLPATLVTGTSDVPLIPQQWHDDIVTWCLIRAHERNENWAAVERLQAEFGKNLYQRQQDQDQTDDTYAVIRDDAWEESIFL